MSKFIPYPFTYDRMPVDLSFIFEQEKPAGKHGFMKVNGELFEFEDGTPARFWGVNFNGGANFPEFAYSEKVAKRLASVGVNLVRFHQLDAEWNTPNIFSFSKGKRVTNTQCFDPESMKRLDYLIYCLKNEGIYCYMDMFTYRKFKSGDGVVQAYHLVDEAKSYSIFDDRLIELQVDHAKRLWSHMNPYTGLAYKDDPVFVMAEVSNENDLFVMKDKPQDVIVEPYVTQLKQKYSEWLETNGVTYDAWNCDLNKCDDDPVIKFKMHLQRKYYEKIISCLRETGVKIPITGNNWRSYPANVRLQQDTDYVDGHAYFYDWRWGEFEKHCMNRSVVEENASWLSVLGANRICGKPFFVSEWDMPWPNAYRAESPVYAAAIGMLQGWSGFSVHTYAYTALLDREHILGKEIYSAKIGGTPYREGIFSTWNDPAKFGLFYHAALMTRRGDVKESKVKYAVSPFNMTTWNVKPYDAGFETARIATVFEDGDAGDSKMLEDSLNVDPNAIISQDGQLFRSISSRYGYIDTERTKCIYGFLKRNGNISINGLSVKCENEYAVVALSSLSDERIEKTDNMLLTVVGKAENTDFKMDGDTLIEYGRAPVTIEVIEAEIKICTEKNNLNVWAISPEGLYIGKIPTEYKDGILTLKIGEQSQSMYYLIVEE